MGYNDYELLDLVNAGNEEAVKLLYDKYKPLMESKVKKAYKYVFNKGLDEEDLLQEVMIGFEEAIRGFKLTEDVLFYTFVNVIIDRKLNTLIRKANALKNRPLNEAVTLNYGESDGYTLMDFIAEDNNPERGIISSENEKELFSKIKNELTNFENIVFELKLQDFNYKEIAVLLEKDSKAIDNALTRIRNKISKLLEK